MGGGVRALAAAIQLTPAGDKVRPYERAATAGGKPREPDLGARNTLPSPTVLAMRWAINELFDGRLADYLPLTPIDPLCRHFSGDQSQLDLFTDADQSREAIRRFAGSRDADGYMKFRKQAHKIFDIVKKPFMEEAVPSLFD